MVDRCTRIAAVAAALWMGCARGPAATHQVLDAGAEPLRARFNADSGKVRAIFLASPT